MNTSARGLGAAAVVVVFCALPARTAPQTAGDRERGLALVRQSVAAMGGADRLDAVKGVMVKGDIVLSGPMGEVKGDSVAHVLYPDKIKSVINLPMGQLVQAYDGTTAWMRMGGQTQELPATLNGEMERSILTSGGIGIMRAALDGRAEVEAVEPADAGGVQADVLLWRMGEQEMRIFLDAGTHLISKLGFRAETPQGPADIEIDVSDFRETAGIRIPWKVVGYQNGEKYLELAATDVQLNPAVDPASFSKP